MILIAMKTDSKLTYVENFSAKFLLTLYWDNIWNLEGYIFSSPELKAQKVSL